MSAINTSLNGGIKVETEVIFFLMIDALVIILLLFRHEVGLCITLSKSMSQRLIS